jgi:hypothetical protein
MQRRAWLLLNLALSVILILASPVVAEQGSIAVELNKLEPNGGQCKAYFVIDNKNSTNYQELKLDLVLFLPDKVIGRRFAVDLAPLKANKRTVKLFELADIACDQVGSLLINEVMQCKAETGPLDDCLRDIAPSSLTKAPLSK